MWRNCCAEYCIHMSRCPVPRLAVLSLVIFVGTISLGSVRHTLLRGGGTSSTAAFESYRHPSWTAWYEAMVRGGDAQFTSGHMAGGGETACIAPRPMPPGRGDTAGAFSDPAHFWSASATVEFGGNWYADGKPRIMDVRASCCRSMHRWPKCWADDYSSHSQLIRQRTTAQSLDNYTMSHDLRTIYANKRALQSRDILFASLRDNVLTLECAHGPQAAWYSESVGEFKWKRMPSSTTSITNIYSSAVVIRCYCSRGLLQRAREFIQLHLHEFTPNGWLRQTSFLSRYWEENEQCIESDLMLIQAVEQPKVRDRLEHIWSKKTASTPGEQDDGEAKAEPFVNIMYVFLDSTSRRHWVNNARETTAILRQLTQERIATTFGFPFAHALGYGTTERAFTAGLGGSRFSNFGNANFSEWRMLNRLWDRARDAGWFTSFSAETCFTHEHRSLFNDAPSNMTMAEKLNAMGDHTMYDAFCGVCDNSVETFCDSGKARTQYRNGNYYTKNFLGDERSCEGGRRPSSNFLEFTRKTMDLYEGFPSLHIYEWASAHLFREEKHVCAAMRHFDGSLSAFLRDIKRSGLMNRTMFILVGDHGNWNVEEKMNPMVSITAPNWWLEQQDAMSSLHANQREVITHLDIHATVMDVIKQQTGPRPLDNVFSSPMPEQGKPQLPAESVEPVNTKGWHGWRYGMPGFPGKSLLRALPSGRGCSEAGVDEYEEACMISSKATVSLKEVTTKVQASPAFVHDLAREIDHGINSYVDIKYRPTCRLFSFDSVVEVRSRMIPDSSTGQFKLFVKWFAKPLSPSAGKREFRCDVMSKINPFELRADSHVAVGTVLAVPKTCKQISTWGMNKDCMPKGIGKKQQEFCSCLDDAGLVIEAFRL